LGIGQILAPFEKMATLKLSILIPVFNEVESIRPVVERLLDLPINKELVIVDDCSTDGSSEVVGSLECDEVQVCRHMHNLGKGAAIRTGLDMATGDVIVIQDADLEYDPAEIPLLLEVLQKQNVRVVYGYRDLSRQQFVVRWGNLFLTLITNVLFNGRLKDMESCYKMLTIELARSLNLRSVRFEIEAEITAKLLKRREVIVQIPIKYIPRVQKKKLVPFKDGPQGLWALIRFRFTD